MEASQGRRRRRKRDTTPDAIGLALKERLLRDAIAADPEPDRFEDWLLGRMTVLGEERRPPGAVLAMARSILEDWRLASHSPGFRAWLDAGAPSDDTIER